MALICATVWLLVTCAGLYELSQQKQLSSQCLEVLRAGRQIMRISQYIIVLTGFFMGVLVTAPLLPHDCAPLSDFRRLCYEQNA